ncbi:MAG: TadE/TadG family type IV pilus assembly protein [Candidatus Nanopelagicales bacterium]|nr:pilus assembly protein [Actinomycetota bacterium]MDA9334001.1 pilus assembly protein [Actinomycetota bacterium]MDC1474584.1 pilus assembly protein [Candidatus Nanopelagicales bacterium]HBK39730.1 pilus assembly protein TadE [Actinomycetota bacterium]
MSPHKCSFVRTRLQGDSGNASVEFALVAPLLMLVALAVLQLMLAIHVRSVVTGAAIEGARVAALVDGDLTRAESRTRSILERNFAGTAVQSIRASQVTEGENKMFAVVVETELPLIGFYGPTSMRLTGHALAE